MIRSTMIVEIAGTPPEHVKKSLSEYILNLNSMREVEVHSIKISDPASIPEAPDMFTCFAEADFSVSDVTKLSEIVFDFMPSSIEITNPATISLDSIQATELFNAISGRMHRYDDIAKASHMKIKQLTRLLEQKGIISQKQVPVSSSVSTKSPTKKKASHKKKKTASKKKHAKKKSSKK